MPKAPEGPLGGGVGSALSRLERTLLTSRRPVAELGHIADPLYLHLLFRLQLYALIRRGPVSDADRGLVPRRLVSIAQQAAGVGALPLATPFALRRHLQDAESNLQAAGAWRATVPLWWQPLPPLTTTERLWADWHQRSGGPLSLPSGRQLSTAFGDAATSSGFLAIPSFLDVAFARQLYAEVDAAHRVGHVELERGGVGAGGALSSSRWDRVGYFSGLEPALLQSAPLVVAFVQWCLHALCEQLAPAMAGKTLYAPQTAMLARYPAPCGGYLPHVDNPGGEADNGRTLTLVMYLNPPEEACAGGELAWWAPDAAADAPPAGVLPARAGSAVLFDSRTVVHQVQPLQEGPDRWALSIWFSDVPQQPVPVDPLPPLTVTDVLLPLEAPPLRPGVVLFHELDDEDAAGRITVRPAPAARERVGVVSTVYQGGSDLDGWCEHHFGLGVDHIVLVFDHLDQPGEAADAARLAAAYPSSRLTVWSGADLLADGWPSLPDGPHVDELRRFAVLGSSSVAVAARQALNASVALQAAKGDGLGGAALDWLLHLDVDELFYLEGAGRGGDTMADHVAAAGAAGFQLVRYVNHELFLPQHPGSGPRFKVNPRLAAARLGTVGWARLVQHLEMSQSDPRPYFTGYLNGKSSVRVAAGSMAAGVHSWFLTEPLSSSNHCFLAGPSILHFHLASPVAFRAKYLRKAASPALEGPRLFAPSPTEDAALTLIRALQGAQAGEESLARHLDELHARLTTFSETEVELLQEAGLLVSPDLGQFAAVGSTGAAG